MDQEIQLYSVPADYEGPSHAGRFEQAHFCPASMYLWGSSLADLMTAFAQYRSCLGGTNTDVLRTTRMSMQLYRDKDCHQKLLCILTASSCSHIFLSPLALYFSNNWAIGSSASRSKVPARKNSLRITSRVCGSTVRPKSWLNSNGSSTHNK